MKARFAALGAVLLSVVTSVTAHRLDEYLQATILAVEKDRVKLEIYLTPGVAVMPTVLADVDADGNGALSEVEQRAYAARVLADLALTLNGTRLAPRLVTFEFPKLAELKEGRGDIHLEVDADLPRSAPQRILRLANRHQNGIAVYQVNCLASRTPDIRIGAQRRDYGQSVYELEYTQADAR